MTKLSSTRPLMMSAVTGQSDDDKKVVKMYSHYIFLVFQPHYSKTESLISSFIIFGVNRPVYLRLY